MKKTQNTAYPQLKRKGCNYLWQYTKRRNRAIIPPNIIDHKFTIRLGRRELIWGEPVLRIKKNVSQLKTNNYKTISKSVHMCTAYNSDVKTNITETDQNYNTIIIEEFYITLTKKEKINDLL